MAFSPNKGYNLQDTGDNVNLWGSILNSGVFGIIDQNLGGLVSKGLTNVQVDLSDVESQALRLVLTGVLTANVLVTTQCIGMTIVENQCSGNFTVTFQKNGVGAPITLPNGTNNVVVTGASGNPAIAGIDFPAGTRLPFQQTTPPPGYTKDTATAGLNNSSMRLVTGAVVNGGSLDFTTAFADRVLGGAVQAMTLDITQIPPHTHTYDQPIPGNRDTGTGASNIESRQLGVATGSAGGGQPHTHGLTLNNLNMAVRYFDFSIGVRA